MTGKGTLIARWFIVWWCQLPLYACTIITPRLLDLILVKAPHYFISSNIISNIFITRSSFVINKNSHAHHANINKNVVAHRIPCISSLYDASLITYTVKGSSLRAYHQGKVPSSLQSWVLKLNFVMFLASLFCCFHCRGRHCGILFLVMR